jgi:branched-chain amino acid transport system permease protein
MTSVAKTSGSRARPTGVARWLGTHRYGAGWSLAGLVVFIILITTLGSSQYVYQLDLALLAAMGAIGLNLIAGFAGQFSIGAAAFLAVGAYTVVFLDGKVPFPIPVIAAGVVAALVGLIIGVPSLRLRGLYLLFSTLVLLYLVSFLAEQYDNHTNALAGHSITTPGFLSSQTDWAVLLLIVLIVTAWFVQNMASSHYGRALFMLRTNEAAASVLGVNVVRVKLQTFAASSAILGIAGALSAYFVGYVSYDSYTLPLSTSYIAMMMIGGLASVGGSVIGAFIVSLIPFVLQQISSGLPAGNFVQANAADLDAVVYSALVIVFVFLCPTGVVGLAQRLRRRTLAARSPRALMTGPEKAGVR